MDVNTAMVLIVALMIGSMCFMGWIALRPMKARQAVKGTVVSWVVTEENRGGLPIGHGRWMLEITGPNQMKLAWLDPEQAKAPAPVTDDRS